MSTARGNAKPLCDFIELSNHSKNSQSGTVLEINLLLPFAAGTFRRRVETFVVGCFAQFSSDEFSDCSTLWILRALQGANKDSSGVQCQCLICYRKGSSQYLTSPITAFTGTLPRIRA